KRAHACVQLRQDDAEGRLFNMVGFQTKMTYPEQRRVFRMIPGLTSAEFVRLGSLHRNTFVDAPALLLPSLQVMGRKRLLLAGQLVGVEGYVESAATGLLAGLNAGRLLAGQAPLAPPRTTALGSLLAYVTQRGKKAFQPMNANYGLFPPLARATPWAPARRARAPGAHRGCGRSRPPPCARPRTGPPPRGRSPRRPACRSRCSRGTW